MKSELNRLRTFDDWPCAFMDPRDLARVEFYYLQRDDIVRCVFCRVTIGLWEIGDNAAIEYQRLSTSCPFLDGVDVGNIPLGPNEVPASQDFYGCFDHVHQELSKLSITPYRGPVYPEYSYRKVRLRTFKRWTKRPDPAELSEEGFFYGGESDQTVCFSRGGGLVEWGVNNDSSEQHARWFSKCSFLSMMKGRFTSGVHTSASAEDTPNLDGRLCKICHDEELGVMFLPCGHVVTCVKCAPSLSTCAVCRQPFRAIARAFLS